VSGFLPGTGYAEGAVSTAVSFNIPLAASLTNPSGCGEAGPACQVHYIKAPTQVEVEKHEFPAAPAGCAGNVTEPGAAEGNLCVFAFSEINVSTLQEPVHVCPSSTGSLFICLVNYAPVEADPYGFIIATQDQEKGLVALNGTWAVTAE
jgi:hypothetical protein